MSILQDIITHKAAEVRQNKELRPLRLLEQSIYFRTPVVSMSAYLRRPDMEGIIAEIKRKSPSAGMLREYIDVEQLSIGYMQAGASALSVLSDNRYFGGSNDDVTTARKFNYCPVLRKDFIIDPYQVAEARSIGADCILLIAAAVDPATCRTLAREARELGMEVILEVHSREEIESHLNEYIDIVGINNRNLHDFSTSLETSIQLAELLPRNLVRISESGLSDAHSIVALRQNGFDGFLIGTHFMRHGHPEEACARLINELKTLRA
jgi:indole-3-glycerol phosphate synthase